MEDTGKKEACLSVGFWFNVHFYDLMTFLSFGFELWMEIFSGT